jgi:hypothetical protein
MVKLARDEGRQHDGLAGLRESLLGPVRRREFELWIRSLLGRQERLVIATLNYDNVVESFLPRACDCLWHGNTRGRWVPSTKGVRVQHCGSGC